MTNEQQNKLSVTWNTIYATAIVILTLCAVITVVYDIGYEQGQFNGINHCVDQLKGIK